MSVTADKGGRDRSLDGGGRQARKVSLSFFDWKRMRRFFPLANENSTAEFLSLYLSRLVETAAPAPGDPMRQNFLTFLNPNVAKDWKYIQFLDI